MQGHGTDEYLCAHTFFKFWRRAICTAAARSGSGCGVSVPRHALYRRDTAHAHSVLLTTVGSTSYGLGTDSKRLSNLLSVTQQ